MFLYAYMSLCCSSCHDSIEVFRGLLALTEADAHSYCIYLVLGVVADCDYHMINYFLSQPHEPRMSAYLDTKPSFRFGTNYRVEIGPGAVPFHKARLAV